MELQNGDGAQPVTVFTQIEYLLEPANGSDAACLEYRAAALERVVVHPGDVVEFWMSPAAQDTLTQFICRCGKNLGSPSTGRSSIW